MIIEIVPAEPGELFARLVIDGQRQNASAVFFDLTAGREAMTVWKPDGQHEAMAFLAEKAPQP